jgi:hypothetical protein
VPTTTLNKNPAVCSGQFFLSILFFLLTVGMQAQTGWSKSNCPRSHKQAEVWYFGEKAGIDFRVSPPTGKSDPILMNAMQATSSICDSMGNFQFYTNGRVVWDKTFTPMPNATGLAGDPGATQPCLIVPWPGDSTIYYVFTIDMIKYDNPLDSTQFSTRGLTYTLIDMKERNGLGDAASSVLNKELLTPVCQKITAVANRDNTGFWVIAHKWESNEFYA